jgi:hypothetical protein
VQLLGGHLLAPTDPPRQTRARLQLQRLAALIQCGLELRNPLRRARRRHGGLAGLRVPVESGRLVRCVLLSQRSELALAMERPQRLEEYRGGADGEGRRRKLELKPHNRFGQRWSTHGAARLMQHTARLIGEPNGL